LAVFQNLNLAYKNILANAKRLIYLLLLFSSSTNIGCSRRPVSKFSALSESLFGYLVSFSDDISFNLVITGVISVLTLFESETKSSFSMFKQSKHSKRTSITGLDIREDHCVFYPEHFPFHG